MCVSVLHSFIQESVCVCYYKCQESVFINVKRVYVCVCFNYTKLNLCVCVYNNNIVYFCSTDGKLYQYDLDSGAETELSHDLDDITCSGRSMIYSSERNSIIFPFRRAGGFGGLAEYLLN